MEREKRPIDDWYGERVNPGESRDLKITLGESYSGHSVTVPVHVKRGHQDGPVVFVTGAMHGDELNGTGAIRHIIHDSAFRLNRGALILLPVANILGFERHSRYLPDRRDLNRCFPGSPNGSLASRLAHVIFREVVERSDYGIDLHTAAVRRTNFPNLRAQMAAPGIRELVELLAAEFTIDSVGPKGSFRREATRKGCPTVVLEAGEVWKVEPGIVSYTTRCIKNALAGLNMIDATIVAPRYRINITKTKWVRAERGGFLQFHVHPGDPVEKGTPLATNTNLLGEEQNVLVSPFRGVVIGMTTLPAVVPGEPVCNLGQVSQKNLSQRQQAHSNGDGHPLSQVSTDLASNVLVVDREE
jgi:predicted deacylase